MQISTNRWYTQVLSAINEVLGISLTLSSPEWDLHNPCGMEDSCKWDPHSLTQYFILFYISSVQSLGFPGGTCGKEPACQCGRQETQVQSLEQENRQEEEMATHSSIRV